MDQEEMDAIRDEMIRVLVKSHPGASAQRGDAGNEVYAVINASDVVLTIELI